MGTVFEINKDSLVKRLVFIDGFSRSGKFFLGKIVSGLKGMEYFQSVDVIEQIGFMQRLGGITEDAAIALLKAIVDEYSYNMRIGRSINFRHQDASSIYHSHEVDEYLKRSVSVIGEQGLTNERIVESFRHDLRYSLFVVHEILPNIDIFTKAYPQLKIIELIRHPVDVAHSWFVRGWGRRFSIDPLSFTPVVSGVKTSVPWYVRGWEKKYEESCEVDRIINSLFSLTTLCEKTINNLSSETVENILFVRYEDLVENTHEVLGKMGNFLGTESSEGMPVICAREKCPKTISLAKRANKLKDLENGASAQCIDVLGRLAEEYESRENPYVE